MNINIKNKDMSCIQEELLINSMLAEQKIDEACDRISSLIGALANSKEFVGKVLTSHSYDNFINKIASLFPASGLGNRCLNKSKEKEVICIVVTELYKTGGHTEIVRLLKNIYPESIVVATNYFGGLRAKEMPVQVVKGMPDVVIPAGKATEKISILSNFLATIAGRVILVTHHHDIVALVAAIRTFENPFFIFHSDHRISLGHTIEAFTHVALLPEAMKNDPAFDGFYKVCQSVYDYGRKFNAEISLLNTCTIGGGEKFDWHGEISLPKIISSILVEFSTSKHHHVGLLSSDQLSSIHKELDSMNIDRSKFFYVGAVDSLWLYLNESDVNIVIGSAPIHGIRSSIETMGAGVPYLPYFNAVSDAVLDRIFYPRNAAGWQNIKDLIAVIKKVQGNYNYYSDMMRDHYNVNYSYDLAKRDLDCLIKSVKNNFGIPNLFNQFHK